MENVLTLDIGNPNADRFWGAVQGGGIFDLDGDKGGNTFRSAYDTFSGNAVGRLYYAHFDARDLGPIKNLRAGRQYRYDFESLYYDGVTLEMAPVKNFSLTTFGGVPVHLFENQIGFDPGDWLVGGALQWNPHAKLQARFDYTHLRDKVSGFRASGGDFEDNLFGGTVWLDLDPRVGLVGRFTAFADQVRDVSFETGFRIPEKDFSLRFHFFRLLKGYDIRVIDWDAYRVAGTYQPYTELSLNATKGFGNHFAVDGGFSHRSLDDVQVASAFNHGFDRGYLSFSLFDLPIKGLSLTATSDYYHGRDNTLRDNSFGASFTASQNLLSDRLRLTAGTLYYLYKYNLLTGDESSNVRTYFAEVRGKLTKHFEAGAGYNFERNSFNDFHSLDLRAIWSF